MTVPLPQKEQAALRKMEEAAAAEEKRRRQQEMRDMLDLSLKMKMRKKAKDEQEQLAFDLKMLEQLLEESRNEAKEQLQRKVSCYVLDHDVFGSVAGLDSDMLSQLLCSHDALFVMDRDVFRLDLCQIMLC